MISNIKEKIANGDKPEGPKKGYTLDRNALAVFAILSLALIPAGIPIGVPATLSVFVAGFMTVFLKIVNLIPANKPAKRRMGNKIETPYYPELVEKYQRMLERYEQEEKEKINQIKYLEERISNGSKTEIKKENNKLLEKEENKLSK